MEKKEHRKFGNPHSIPKKFKIPPIPIVKTVEEIFNEIENGTSSIKTDEELEKQYIKKYDADNLIISSNGSIGFKGRSVKGIFEGIKFDSKLELIYYLYTKDIEGKSITRNTDEFLWYFTKNGKMQKFFPDFKVEGKFVEIKGLVSDWDKSKREQHSFDCLWLVYEENIELFSKMKKKVEKMYPYLYDYYLNLK